MRRIDSPGEMRALAEETRRAGRRIAFVPTMGALHVGHASLLDEGRRRAELLVLSIFVNPMQFGPSEDLARYPRTPETDEARGRDAGVDVIYAPEPAVMYPPGFQTSVTVERIEQGLCGAERPGHFRGVATVVLKLFSAVQPHVALFGQKDYQQLQLIRRMARDLDLGVEIVGMPIVRDSDGLALSSRNAYLSVEERERALCLVRALRAIEACYAAGERDAQRLLHVGREVLAVPLAEGAIAVDYLELRDAESLQPIERVENAAVAAIAARVGRTRLIDNLVLAG